MIAVPKWRQLFDGFEDALALVAPKIARSRQVARVSFEARKRAAERYDAAGRGRRAADWVRADAGPNESTDTRTVLRARSRDMRRNNPYARRAVDAIVSNTVGNGVKARIRSKDGKTHHDLQTMWDDWAASTDVDADGLQTFAGMQRLMLAGVVESGETLLRLRRRSADEGLMVPIQLQMLEADYLEETPALWNRPVVPGHRIAQGIELNPAGQRVAYWLHTEHPGSSESLGIYGEDSMVRVHAGDICHSYRLDRPGQRRGVPWMSPILARLHDLDQYEDAQLERQRVQSLFACFVTDDTGDLDPAVAASSQAWEAPDTLEPGGMLELPPGRKVEFSDPPEASGYADYMRANLHAIGAGIGVPYMLLTGDLSSANFSSSRMGRLEFQRQIREWHDGIVFPFCKTVFRWWLDAVTYTFGIDTEGVHAEWSAPRPEMVDPQKETGAQADRIRNGLTSHQRVLREQGDDPEQILAELVEWNERLDAAGVVLDSDPRKQAKGGYRQPSDEPLGEVGLPKPDPDPGRPEDIEAANRAAEEEIA